MALLFSFKLLNKLLPSFPTFVITLSTTTATYMIMRLFTLCHCMCVSVTTVTMLRYKLIINGAIAARFGTQDLHLVFVDAEITETFLAVHLAGSHRSLVLADFHRAGTV